MEITEARARAQEPVECPECGFANIFWGKRDRELVIEHFGRRCQGLVDLQCARRGKRAGALFAMGDGCYRCSPCCRPGRLRRNQTNMAQAVEASGTLHRIGNGVLMLFGVFILFSMLRLVGWAAAAIGRNREYFPNFVLEFFL